MKLTCKVTCLVLLSVCCIPQMEAAITDCGNLGRYVRIRNQASGLILSPKGSNTITIENFDNSEEQQWHFQLSDSVGMFNILNRATQLALDFNPVSNADYGGSEFSFNLTLATFTDSVNQRWIIDSDGTIVNNGLHYGDYDYGINIPSSDYDPGNFLILYPIIGNITDNEKFILEFEVKK